MSILPANVNFLASAASSAAKARGVAPIEFTTDGLDVAVALKCIGSYQLEGTPSGMEKLDNEENAGPLIAAARTLQSSAEHLATAREPDWDSIWELRLCASLAHAMYGNFPSAKAVLNSIPASYLISSPMRCSAAVVVDSAGPLAIQSADPIAGIEGFRFYWYHMLRASNSTIRSQHLEKAEELLGQIAIAATQSSDQALALSLQVAMRQAHRLSITSLYDLAPEIPAWFVERCTAANILTLLPPQYDLLARKRIAKVSGNSLLTLPTSTGKTLIAEACMAAASYSEGLSIFVAPYVAIGEQVRASLSAKVGENIKLVSMFGGFKYESLARANGQALVVMTPERFDAWLRTGEHLEQLRLVVFDEIHIVENGSRGARVEGVISRLRLLQRRLPHLRILGLSAVLAEPENICHWLGIEKENLHRISWRPTARRIAVCRANGRMHWIHGNDALRPTGQSPDSAISQDVAVLLPKIVGPHRNPTVYEENASHNVAAVAIDLLNRLQWPGLVVCPKRADTRLLARSLANQIARSNDPELLTLADSILGRYGWLNTLAECLRHGVAYHNASLPYDVRRDIEQITRAKKLYAVCSTTTLAEGADLPFRWTLISHWLGSDGQALKSMTFRNIAGRSGRAGAFTEGDTILFENRGGPIEAYRSQNMTAQLNSVMFASSPVISTAGGGYLNLPESEQASIQAVFSSQLVAAILENDGADDIVTLFRNATYAVYAPTQGSIGSVLHTALLGLLDSTKAGGAFALMNSPVRLTPVGMAVNRSGFSPGSARAILSYLLENTVKPTGVALLNDLLIKFANIDEQQDYLWKKVVAEPRQIHPLKLPDLYSVLEKLQQSRDLRSIFDELPARKKSRANESNVEKQFDNFISLVDSLIFGFLPWLLRGLGTLAPFGSEAARAVDWTEIARRIEVGSDLSGLEDESSDE